jgi:hypothetical protein
LLEFKAYFIIQLSFLPMYVLSMHCTHMQH